MPEEVRQSTGSQSVNADRSNNLVRNIANSSSIRNDMAALFNHYEERNVSNDFSRQSQETEQTLQKGMDI
jgi:hypothetical protein